MSQRRRPQQRLCPVKITEYRLVHGRRQRWAAESADGVWSFHREESSGTPWWLEHVPSGVLLLYSSLPAARAAVESGKALERVARELLDRLDAEIAKVAAEWAAGDPEQLARARDRIARSLYTEPGRRLVANCGCS